MCSFLLCILSVSSPASCLLGILPNFLISDDIHCCGDSHHFYGTLGEGNAGAVYYNIKRVGWFRFESFGKWSKCEHLISGCINEVILNSVVN